MNILKRVSAAVLLGVFSFIGIHAVYAQIATNAITYFPLDKNINVGDEIELDYLESSGQWYSLTPDILENFGAGLFRALSEGYGKARLVTPNDGPRETVVGVIDPTKSGASEYDVSLVSRYPIYDWADAKFNHEHGVSPFYNIDYIPGASGSGHFAVVGSCADGLDARIGNQFVHSVELEDGGMYVFTESGQFISKENICRETMTPTGCYEGGGCEPGRNISLVGSNQFILDTGGLEFGHTPRRSPLLYNISGNRVSKENRLFFNDRNNPVDYRTEKALVEFRHIAYTNGIMVGYAKESTGNTPPRISGFPGGGNPTAEKNIFFSVPEFQRLAEISTPTTCPTRSCTGSPSITQEVYIPIFGIGEYFVAARPDSLHYTINIQPPYDVYRMPSRQELRDGIKPQKVQTLDIDRVISNITRDATNPNRIMVSGLRGNNFQYTIYEPGENGLEVVGNGTLSAGGGQWNVALSGDYVAFSSCTKDEGGNIFDYSNVTNCELVVEKNGNPLSVEPLPLNLFAGGGIPGVAISPSGYIMVAAYNLTGIDGENGNLYLYKIGGGTGTPTIPTPPTLPTLPSFPQTITPDINFFLKSAQSYVDSLVSIFGSPSQSTPNTTQFQSQTQTGYTSQSGYSYTLSRPPQTIAEIRQFQCAYDIVCGGTIETTGWGNLGPKTRAKIEEVFGGYVQGASISLSNASQNQSIFDIITGTLDITASILGGVLR